MSEQANTVPAPASEPKNSDPYKKSSWTKWLLIYAVIGLLVYGVVYYFLVYKKSSGNPYGGGATPTQAQNTSTEKPTVVLTDKGFDPKSLKVKAGTEVVWLNNSGKTATVNSSVHPTHLDYPPLNLGQFANGESLSLKFDTPGTYKYHNHLDASVTGEVIVE